MSSFTFQHFIDVVFIILYPPVITQLCAQHLLRDSILGHINHRVSILTLDGEQINMLCVKLSLCNLTRAQHKCQQHCPASFTESPWQNWADVWSPRAQSRATQTRGRATAGPPAQPGRGQWSSCWYCGPMGCSFGWCSGWWSGRCRGSRRCPWCSSSLGGKMWAGGTSRGPAGHSSFLHTQLQAVIS